MFTNAFSRSYGLVAQEQLFDQQLENISQENYVKSIWGMREGVQDARNQLRRNFWEKAFRHSRQEIKACSAIRNSQAGN